jgi:low-density lipoprotein receptor class B
MAAVMAHGEGGLRRTGVNDDGRQRRRARLRGGFLAAAVATALVSLACGGSPAGASPAPGPAAAGGGYLYWSNTTGSITKPGNGVIVRSRLNGTDVDKKFITGASLPGMVLVYGGYVYWANIVPIRNGAGTIGRARLNGTDVNQKFITGANAPDGVNQTFLKTAQPDGPDAVVAGSGHLYWANDYSIGRANLNGTGVNQRFITGASFPDAIAAGSRYLYWTNQNSYAIGRARLDGTDVNQRFVAGRGLRNLHGIAVDPCSQ